MAWLKWLVVAGIVVGVGIVALAAFGASRWAAGTRALQGRLEAARQPISPTRYDAARELDGCTRPCSATFAPC